MGRLNPEASSSDEAPNNVVHFSHPHQLELRNPQTPPDNLSCSACHLNVDAGMGPIYTCKPCNFTLHLNCYKLPQEMNHPFDQHHALTLQPRPVYPGGLFCCDACGNHGGGFSYHCGPCRVDLHTTCATLLTQFAHECHHHRLGLHYAAPYPGNAFSCDVCNRPGSNTWIYSCCEGCEFDTHLTCVAKLIPGPDQAQPPQGNARAPPLQSNGVYCAAPRPQPVVMAQPQGQFTANSGRFRVNNSLNQPVYGVRPGPAVNRGGLANQFVVGAVGGLATSFAQLTTEAVRHGIFGGGGGSGSRFYDDYDGSSFDGDDDDYDGSRFDGDDDDYDGSCFDGDYDGTDVGYDDGDDTY